MILELIAEAQASGARLGLRVACSGISARTIERWRADPTATIVAVDRTVGRERAVALPRRRRS